MSVQTQKVDLSASGALLETFPDALLIVDRGGRIVMINTRAEALFGYGRDALVEQPVELLVPESQVAAHVGHREHYFQKPRPRPMNIGLELNARRSDGSELPVEITLSPIETTDGTMVCAAVRDVTEQRRARELLRLREHELSQLNQQLSARVDLQTRQMKTTIEELDAFAYSVSHDLRAPLRSIDGFTRILAERYVNQLDEQGRGYLERVLAATKRMGGLIDDLLSLSRLSRQSLRVKSVDLSRMVEKLLAELQANEPERRVDIRVQPGLKAQADPKLMRVALFNLLSNAWKFSRNTENAVIEFGAGEAREAPVFMVRDNGAGFDMQYASKLFDAFQRMHSEHEFPGFGIGLATVKRIINRHHGRIWADSEVGKGATFEFTLPEQHEQL